MTPKRQDFETEPQRRFTAAVAAGRSSIRIVSGELHTGVGGYPGQDHRMPLCCQGMKNATRGRRGFAESAERPGGDADRSV